MKSNIFLAGLLIISTFSYAQKSLVTDTFNVVKEYQPTLINASKIGSEPTIDDDFKIELDLDYSFIKKQVPVSFSPESIAPAKIKGEPLIKLYNGYARLGVGNALLPFGEVYYSNLRSKKFAAGVHAQYLNQRELNNIEGSQMSKAHFEVFGKRFWKANTLNSSIAYDLHNFNYYGYYDLEALPTAVELPAEDLEQQYNRISASFNLKSTKRDSFNLRHEGSLDYKLTTNRGGNAENNIKAALNLNQFRNSELYNLDLSIDYNQYDFNNDNTIIGLVPQISTIGDKFRINAGLGVFVNADTNADFHFYPMAEIKYNVIEDVLVPYVGVKGGIQRVNYHSITLENPFVAEDIVLANTNENYNIYLGLRGALSSKLSFNASGSIRKTSDAYLFVQLADTNRLLSEDYYLTYDDINEFQLKGELVYTLNEKIKLYALGQFFDFDTDEEQRAWHRPDLKISTSVEYSLRDKIIVNLDLIYWGQQFARGEVSGFNGAIALFEERKLDPIFDANISFEYRYTKRLSAFIEFNNIGGINFEKYQNYPTQGFNTWGGLTYGF